MLVQWRIELFGGLQAANGEQILTRFRTHKTAALLAYLAYHRHRSHSRDILVDLFWPESEPGSGRQNLSQALSSLRHVLEPKGVPAGTVICADRGFVRLNPTAVTTDVAAFETALADAARTQSHAEQAQLLAEAVELYRGPLLPGSYESWILGEQERLSQLYFQALEELIGLLEATGERERALGYARRGVSMDPLREGPQRAVMRLLAATGERGTALRHYRELEQLLERELGTGPDGATRALAREMASASGGIGEAAEPGHRLPHPCPDSIAESVCAGYLPHPISRFFGREEECARLCEMLQPGGARLVTLTGPGGSGKTRLALEVAHRLGEAWHGRVWFVPLEHLSDARLILDAVRSSLRLPASTGVDPLEQLAAVLGRQPTLLLVDNFEHLVEEGALTVRTLLERVGSLSCLLTSRRLLEIAGEREFQVPPLPVPDVGEEQPGQRVDSDQRQAAEFLSERLIRWPSVGLFVDRAQAVRPDFQVTSENAAAIAALCRGVEGLPLALELAAARARILTSGQMAAQLNRRFDFLASRRRDASDRHRTLWATIDWSYRLLSPELRSFFTQLSVFRGGWSVQAAAEVCRQDRALECLEELQKSSLIEAEDRTEEMRFRMLESLREYAAEQLPPAERTALRQRQSDHYLALVERIEPEQVWLDRLEAEHDNLRVALAWLVESGNPDPGFRLASDLCSFWWHRGYWNEGREQFAVLLALPKAEAHTTGRARALYCTAKLARAQGDYERARTLHEECLALRQKLGDTVGMADSLTALGIMARYRGDLALADALIEQSLAIRHELKDKQAIANTTIDLGYAAYARGDFGAASSLFEKSLAIARELGDQQGFAGALRLLGSVSWSQNDLQSAQTHFEQSLKVARESGDKRSTILALRSLGLMSTAQGNLTAARVLHEECLALTRGWGYKEGIARELHSLGNVARVQGDLNAASRFVSESLVLYRELGEQWAVAESLCVLAKVRADQGEYSGSRRLYLESLALWQPRGFFEGVARCLEGLAEVAAAQGLHGRAACLLAASHKILTLHGPLPEHADQQGTSESKWATLQLAWATLGGGLEYLPAGRAAYERTVAATCAALGEQAFAVAWAEGRSLTVEQAIAAACEATADA